MRRQRELTGRGMSSPCQTLPPVLVDGAPSRHDNARRLMSRVPLLNAKADAGRRRGGNELDCETAPAAAGVR